jgi:2'-5' RNA ligase
VGAGTEPLILTLALDGATFARLDGLRRRYFPPERNVVPAHLTLFHALPGENAAQIRRELAEICARQKAFGIEAVGLRSLGNGVAMAFSSAELVRLRQALAREWRDWLTAQDSAKIAPHVTIQNKVGADVARTTLRELEAEFRPFTARAEGLNLWRYLGGPWGPEKAFRFGR